MTTPLTTRVVESGGSRLEVDAAQLKVTAGPDRGQSYDLGMESVRIGSSSQCELVLHDSTVSGRHAEVAVTRNGYRIRDLGSKNGIVLGSWRIERALLADGMRLKLGESTLAVRSLGKVTTFELAPPVTLGVLVAHSIKMRAAVATLTSFAASDVTVLLEGETGTGKEVTAEAVHGASERGNGPFVVLDCGAMAKNLVAGELFGHEPGAFSGATSSREGALERAHGGTLFLDEIGEMPLELQPMLLRAVEKKSARRLGGAQEIAYDIRIIAATNRNLREEVRAGRFREDLYHRLAIGRVQLPALRERKEDILILARQFAKEHDVDLTPEIEALLVNYSWPGNIRELRNTIIRAGIHPGALPTLQTTTSIPPLPHARRDAIDRFEHDYVVEVLRRSQGNVSQAARLAGISRQTMTRLVARHRHTVRED